MTKPFPKKHLPTVLYEGASGVAGSLATLDYPLPPSDEETELPGKWILDMQEAGKVGRVCVWDRPGYGFSEVLGGAELGTISESLWLALDEIKEKNDLVVVGEGFGGYVAFLSVPPGANHVALLPEYSLPTDLTESILCYTSMPRLLRHTSTSPQGTRSRPSYTDSRPDKYLLCSLLSLSDDSLRFSSDDLPPFLGSWARPTHYPAPPTYPKTCRKPDYKNRSILIRIRLLHSGHC